MSYIGNQPTSVAFLTDQFSGNASTTVFTMSVAPATTSSILVAVTGVVQDPSTYAVSGTTLTFSGAPPTGTGNISVRYLGIPASGVVTTVYRTLTEFTATAGQTSFSIPSYTVGFINVYRNGVLLGSADYTATTGTTVVLAVGVLVGDLVTTESFYVSSVLNAIPATAGAVNSTYIANGAVGSTQIATGAVGTTQIASSVTLTTPTLTTPTMTGAVVSAMGSSVITSGTAVASTSGTSIDFTGIPSWAKRVTVMFNGVSTNGTSLIQIQTGAGSVTTSGYNTSSSYMSSSTTSATNSTGFLADSGAASAANIRNGILTLTLLGSNTWIGSGLFHEQSAATSTTVGQIALGGTLDRVRITTVNGTDTFDAGSINIMYE